MPVRAGAVWQGCRRFVVAAQLVVLRHLFGAKDRAGLQMREQVHASQTGLEIADRRGLGGQAIRRDLAFDEQLIECSLALDQRGAERAGGGAHPLVNRAHLPDLGFA